MGNDAVFHISSKLTGGELKLENQVYHLAIINLRGCPDLSPMYL